MLGVVPLGTGNDMARVMGWGAQFNDEEKLPMILREMEFSSFHLVDRWSIQYSRCDVDMSPIAEATAISVSGESLRMYIQLCVCVCVCVCERERERVCVMSTIAKVTAISVSFCVEWNCCVCHSVCVCERESVCVCVSVCECVRESVCECVCVHVHT